MYLRNQTGNPDYINEINNSIIYYNETLASLNGDWSDNSKMWKKPLTLELNDFCTLLKKNRN